jgi:hypothetical protein
LRGGSKEPSIEVLQAAAGFLVVSPTAVHAQEITVCGQSLADSGKVGRGHRSGERERQDAVELNGVVGGEAELAL